MMGHGVEKYHSKPKISLPVFRVSSHDTMCKLFRAFPLESAKKTRHERLHVQHTWFTNIFSLLNFFYNGFF